MTPTALHLHTTRCLLASLRPLLVLAACASLALPAQALPERLDDSSSPRSQVSAPLQWAAGTGDTSLATARTRIEYRLATARYTGKSARVYFVIPALVPGVVNPSALQLEWRGQGLLGQGRARLGERVLVWTGTVPGPWLTDTLDITLQLDPSGMRLPAGMPLRFEPYFEIEVFP